MLKVNNIMAASPVKKAASLLLCRNSNKLNSVYNYQVLMLQRKGSMKSYGSMLAFPGGKCDSLFDTQISRVAGIKNKFMVTALRQCFEQTGIYLAQKPLVQTSKISDLNQIKLEYIASQFYKNTINPAKSQPQPKQQSKILSESQLIKVYKRISQILPPKKHLLPFIRLITVPLLKSRFDAYFYLHKLQQFRTINFLKYTENEKYLHSDQQLVMNQESASYGWYNPLEVLRGFVEKKIKLAPPQFIMLNIMSVFHKYQQLNQFLLKCSNNPINMGPNIVSMVNNSSTLKQQYPYAATLIQDYQFPYQFNFKNQKNDYLISQLKQWQESAQNQQSLHKNRLLFKKPLQFFQDDYFCQCTIEDSVMSKFLDSEKLKTQLQLYQ